MEQNGGDQGLQPPVADPGGGGGGGLLGGGLPAPPPAEPLDNMGSIGAAVIAIANDSAPIISVLEGMAAKINTLTMDNRFTKQENQQLVAAARKAKLAALIGKLTNPMSIRAVTLNSKMNDMIQDLLSTLKSNGQLCVPVSFDGTTILIEAQVVVLEEMSRLLLRDNEVHQIAKDSHIGWALLPYLDEEETASEEKESLKLIKSKAISDAEKAYMSFHVDKNKTSSYSKGSGGRGGASTRGARKGKGGRGGKGKGKSNLNQVAGGTVGKSSKPRSGGCHRCGGPHFVRSCTVAVQKPAS